MPSHLRTFSLTLLVTLCLTAQAPAQPVVHALNPFLPADTENYLTINIRQLLDSPMFKKLGLDAARDALKNADEINDVLKDLGLIPSRISTVSPSQVPAPPTPTAACSSSRDDLTPPRSRPRRMRSPRTWKTYSKSTKCPTGPAVRRWCGRRRCRGRTSRSSWPSSAGRRSWRPRARITWSMPSSRASRRRCRC